MFQSRPCCYCILCTLLGLAITWLMLFGHAPAAHAQEVSFIKEVAPILKENCFACHDAKVKKGKFDMTTYAGFRNGGTKDDPITPGKAKASILIDVLTSMGKDRMPPKDVSKPLAKEKIDIIAKWIDQGAKLDAGIDAKASLVRELRSRWQPPTPAPAYKFPNVVNALAFTPDGKSLVVGGHHELLVWDYNTGKLERRILTRAERTYALAYLPDGKLAVAGGRPGQEGDVRIYNIQAGKPKDLGGVPTVDGVNDKDVLLQIVADADDSLLALAISADGKKLAAGGCDRFVRIFELPSGKLEQSIENHADWVLGVGFSPDGKKIITGSRDRTAKVWDTVAKESVVAFPEANAVYAVVITPDGENGVSACEDGGVRMWAAKPQTKQGKSLGSHGKPALRMAQWIDPKDAKKSLLASSGADGTIKLYNPIGGAALKSGAGFTDWVYAVAISPDGQLVAGGSYNGEVRVFKVADGALIKAFDATPGAIVKVEEKKTEDKKKVEEKKK